MLPRMPGTRVQALDHKSASRSSPWTVLSHAGTKPNFVVLFVDDMGIDQVGVDHTPYGGKLYGDAWDESLVSMVRLGKA